MLGLCSVSFRKSDPEEILQAMQAAELSCIEWGSDIHAPKEDLENLSRLVRLQKQYGICCCSYGTYFRIGVTPIEELEGYIRAAKILGTETLRLWCGNKGSLDYTAREETELLAECKAVASIAEKHAVVLCMECHGGTYTDQKEAALALMEAVDSAHFRMYWQPSQYRTAAENLAYARRLAPYTRQLHVFHWNGAEKLPLGEAVGVWKEYLSCFAEKPNLLLEFMPDGRLESLATEASALKQIQK